eukprot:Pgem_evm1s3090
MSVMDLLEKRRLRQLSLNNTSTYKQTYSSLFFFVIMGQLMYYCVFVNPPGQTALNSPEDNPLINPHFYESELKYQQLHNNNNNDFNNIQDNNDNDLNLNDDLVDEGIEEFGIAKPKYILYRAIGNDLPPRHAVGQCYDNVKFILENEKPLE